MTPQPPHSKMCGASLGKRLAVRRFLEPFLGRIHIIRTEERPQEPHKGVWFRTSFRKAFSESLVRFSVHKLPSKYLV